MSQSSDSSKSTSKSAAGHRRPDTCRQLPKCEIDRDIGKWKEHFKNLSEMISDAASSVRVNQDGTMEMEWITEGFAEKLGYSWKELDTVSSWIQILHPEDISLYLDAIPRVLAGETVHLELRLQSRNGEVFWVSSTSRPQIDPQSKRIVRFVNGLQDISDKKRAEENLKQSWEFLNRILNTLDDPIFVKDEEHRWLLVNDSTCETMGFSREYLLGKSDYDLFPKKQADVFLEGDKRVLDSGETDVNEEQITLQGQLHTISTKKSVLVDPTTSKKYIVGTSRDITERVRMEEELRQHQGHLEDVVTRRTEELQQINKALQQEIAERKRAASALEKQHAELVEAHRELKRLQRMKDEFVAMISHELRTPLVTGLGYLDMLLAGRFGPLTPDANKKMNVARRNLKRLSGLIDDILDFYRLSREDNPYQPNLGRCDLAHLLEECVDDFLMRTERVADQLHLQVDEDTPFVLADVDMLRRAISNLLDNAARHAGEQAKILLRARRDGDSRVLVEVCDDGIGMPEYVAHTVFEPFVSSSRLGTGAGLGLAVVRRILESHGCQAVLESQEDQGTKVSFTLQVAEPPQPEI